MSEPAPNRDDRRTEKQSRRRNEIIEAAAQCFMEQGFHATTIDVVARRLGNTKGQIYHYYGSKTDLFFDVHRVGMAHLFDALAPALVVTGTGARRLEAMLMAHARAMLEFHTFENVVAQGVQIHRFGATTPEQRDTIRTLMDDRDRFEAHFKDALRQGIADGSLRDTDVSITAKTLLGGLQWSIFWYRPRAEETEATRDALARKMVDPLLTGVLT